jgi:hypothetical protein
MSPASHPEDVRLKPREKRPAPIPSFFDANASIIRAWLKPNRLRPITSRRSNKS